MAAVLTLRCRGAHWCTTAGRLRSLLLLEPEEIVRRLLGSQNPRNCAEARYLVWHDDRPTSGFGWNGYLLFIAFLQAYLESRVLVEAASIDPAPRWRQHWCGDPPYSLKCYFRGWSRCERQGLSPALRDLTALPDWRSGRRCTCNATAVLWRASRRSEGASFPGLVARGRYWWYAAMVRVLMRPLLWLEVQAQDFLKERGLDRRPFAVAAVRRGNKSSEVPLIGAGEFANQLLRLRELEGVADVLLQTEAQDAVDEFRRWCGQHGLRLHYTANRRPGFDAFSPKFSPERANMTEEGRIAVLNLLVGSQGAAVVGSLHSAWLKIMPAFMIAAQRRAVLVVGLQGQNYMSLGSYVGAEAAAQQLLRPGEVLRPYMEPATAPEAAVHPLLLLHPGMAF